MIWLWACTGDPPEKPGWQSHGPVAEDISAALGEPLPSATPEQLETFERGLIVADHRFTLAEGLGPGFNVTFCGSCHEKPVPGGSGGLYRNFFLAGERTDAGLYFEAESAGNDSGVIRMNYYGSDYQPRPEVDDAVNIIAQRNPIPFFGVGLMAELEEDDIAPRADPDDLDEDGISGRINYADGFVGRFGRKSQTASIEGFIRGPLFNHAGVTTDPLCADQRAALPVDSSGPEDQPCSEATDTADSFGALVQELLPFGQAAANGGPLTDEDAAPDPEMSTDDLFDLISMAMLMAAPEIEDISDNTAAQKGQQLFDLMGCGDCHTPRLEGPRGPLPLYSDLLIHDMGEDLADGIEMGEAEGHEFRTQPLWGIGPVGPYLHDGRARTLEDAIDLHEGEAAPHAKTFQGLTDDQRSNVVEFLMSLGGREQFTPGLLAPDEPIPPVGEYGAPLAGVDETTFGVARAIFDFEFNLADGVGGPRFNGDSCRACHFEPVIGGAGPRGVNVMRHGVINASGDFTMPAVGTILHRGTALDQSTNQPQDDANVFEARQTPHLFGAGLIDALDEAVIIANADPDDANKDGISGRVSYTDGGRVGRFGWKGQVPSLEEFVRDAVTEELGMTLSYVEGLTFGRLQDNDDVSDPEFEAGNAELMLFFMEKLGPPPQKPVEGMAVEGEKLFASLGCDTCHIPKLEGPDGPVPLYSDLLLHEVLPEGAVGIEDAGANMREFRTAPLWGISETAPYLHDGAADTLAEAIEGHAGEAQTVVDGYLALDPKDRDALIAFLETL